MDIAAWLASLGLEEYAPAFAENRVDGEVLPRLTGDDLREMGIHAVGHRRKLLAAIEVLNNKRRAERRQLTLMFADLVDSTALSVRLDPEDMRDLIRSYQDAVSEAVGRFEGVVGKFLGDGVLAHFGFPIAHEDDAERAVRAGLDVIAAVARLRAPDGSPVAVRVGIATGLVVVGDLVGSGPAEERIVVGETPSLAARLQGMADPGTLIIADATRSIIGDLFDCLDLGNHDLKGFAKPVRAWQVLRAGHTEERFEALRGKSTLPLIGREDEMALLLDRWQRASHGQGQVVLLSGEPGIGKSRMLKALAESLADHPFPDLRYFCSPQFSDTTLHPMRRQLERSANIVQDDPPERKLAKLEMLVAEATGGTDTAVPILAKLLGIDFGDRYPRTMLSPEAQKDKILEVLVDRINALASRQPVLICFEDVHWSDPTSLQLLDRVIARVQSLPALLVITFRPEFVGPWTHHPHVTALSLARLGRSQATVIIHHVAECRSLPTAVVEQILAKTDGVPLFVEEFTKNVLEGGWLQIENDRQTLRGSPPPVAIPATLYDSLTARLDRLVQAKEVAQIGAVVGREFSYGLLAAVTNIPIDHLDRAIDQLCHSGLVTCLRADHDPIFAFKHALIHEAAYRSLLRDHRRELHGRISNALEHQFPEIVRHQPDLLAHHLAEAGHYREAAERWIVAAREALSVAAYPEALAFLERALDIFHEVQQSAEIEGRIAVVQLMLRQARHPRSGRPQSSPSLAEV